MKLRNIILAAFALIAIAGTAQAYYYPITAFDTKAIQVQEIDKPYCSDIDIATSPLTVREGEESLQGFYIDNKSNFEFQVSDIMVTEVDSELDISPYQVDEFIPANDYGTAYLLVQVAPGIEGKTTTAYLKLEGSFSNGTSCSFSDISESFQTIVKGIEAEQTSTNDWATIEFSEPSISNYYSNNVVVDSFNQTTNNYLEENNTYSSEKYQFKPRTTPTSCSSIISYTKAFNLSKNDSKTQYFTVKNDSDKAFYVESIQAFDDSPYFTTTALKADGTSINAHGALQVPVKVESFENSAGKTAAGTFKISGVFEDNSYCSADSIGNNEFSISAVAEEPAELTGGLQLFYPERIEVPTNGQASFTLTVLNSTGNSGYIRIYSNDAIVDATAISLSGAESQTARITVQGLDLNASWIVFDIFLPDRTFNSRIAKIVKVKAQSTPTPTPLPQNPDIGIQTTVQPLADGNYDLNVTVKNESNFPVSGSIQADLPTGWKVSGNSNVNLGPLESRTIVFRAMPPSGFNDKDVQGTIGFETSNGLIFSEPILLKANTPAFAAVFAAFAVLGANAFWLGIISLIVVVLAVLYYTGKSQGQAAEDTMHKWKQSAS